MRSWWFLKQVTLLYIKNISFWESTPCKQVAILLCTTDAAPLDNVYISNISPTLELRWNQSSLYCSSAKYKITSTAVSSNGGCPNTTKLIQNGTTSASYTNEFTSGHNCNFSTETEICENITSGKSTLFLLTFRGNCIRTRAIATECID